MISYVIPTRDRAERLTATLHALSRLHARLDRTNPALAAEIIVIDNDSTERMILQPHLPCGTPIRSINLRTNEGAAARNHGVRAADPRSDWIVMLDDDSHPLDTNFIQLLNQQPEDVGAVMADIWLPHRDESSSQVHTASDDAHNHINSLRNIKLGIRESGGLPEVFIGCGVAIRKSAFLAAGGYDHTFQYYVEEYDLAAKLLIAGYRVAFEPRFRVLHHKDSGQRDMNTILERLVRNNGWVAQRYAPDEQRLPELREVRSRYRKIAKKEHALAGYSRGLIQLKNTIRTQLRTPMSHELFERFTGVAHARMALQRAYTSKPFSAATLIENGKNAWAVAHALDQLGIRVTDDHEMADVLVVATMSPGPMLDAFTRRHNLAKSTLPASRSPRVLGPWLVIEPVPRHQEPQSKPATPTETSARDAA
jgi:GT2 family glycosyltransferase